MHSKEFLEKAKKLLEASIISPVTEEILLSTRSELYTMVKFRDKLLERDPALTEGDLVNILYETLKKKNADYSPEDNAFYNFENSADEIGMSVSSTIKVRMIDKISRMKNLENKEQTSVEDETVADTIMDVMNYMVIRELYEKHVLPTKLNPA